MNFGGRKEGLHPLKDSKAGFTKGAEFGLNSKLGVEFRYTENPQQAFHVEQMQF